MIYTIYLGDLGSLEIDVFSLYYPGRPATGPTYSSGGDPPEPPTVEIQMLSVEVHGEWTELPQWFCSKIYANTDLLDAIELACIDDWEASL